MILPPEIMNKVRGYALLGLGLYVIHTTEKADPELGAELVITAASEEDRSDNRQIGEVRDVEPKPLMPEEMIIRIGFKDREALMHLVDRLVFLADTNFPVEPT